MSDEVEVLFDAAGSAGETATLLLAAAEDLDLPADVVRTTSDRFMVPEEVSKKATKDLAAAKKAADKEAKEAEAAETADTDSAATS